MDKNSGSDVIAARIFVHDFLIGLNAILAQFNLIKIKLSYKRYHGIHVLIHY